MNRYNMNVLADAKEEYTRQLISVLTPEMYVGIKSIYEAAYTHCNKTGDKNIFKKFQLLLSNIPKWDKSKIQNEYARIVRKTECDWIEDLITAVFVSHTKVLSSIQIKNTNKSIPLNVPVGSFFLHKCYEQCARNFWRKSWLLNIDASSIDIQRNMIDSETLINESILETIRKLLPVKYILKEYIGNDYQDEDTVDNIDKSLSASAKKNLRTLVRKELEQTLTTTSVDDNYSSLEIPNDSIVIDTPHDAIITDEDVAPNKRINNEALDKVSAPVEEPVVQEKVSAPVEEPVVQEKVSAPVEEPVVQEKVSAPVEEPVVQEEVSPPLEEPVVQEKVSPPLEEPVVQDIGSPPLEEPVVQEIGSPPLEEPIVQEKEAKLDSVIERTYSDIADYNSIDSGAEDIKKQAIEVELKELTIGTNSDALHEMRRDIQQNSINISDTKEADEFSFFDGAADFY
jgi:hypothetical protein